tara:strand:- start:1502 stop:2155 length:654 start_codon:yes stop_codon:yes gene_type:complete
MTIKQKIKSVLNIGRSYPRTVAVGGHNTETVSLVKKFKPKHYCEIGFYKGHTLMEVLKVLPVESKIHLYDFHDKFEPLKAKLSNHDLEKISFYGNSYKYLDSYNTTLFHNIISSNPPKYDYVFLDGAHTFPIDCLTFFLIEKCLNEGGIIDFDDSDWSLAASPAMNPKAFPMAKKLYNDDQIQEKGVQMIIDAFLKDSPHYETIIEDKAFRRISPQF